jgi:hypothetical protein
MGCSTPRQLSSLIAGARGLSSPAGINRTFRPSQWLGLTDHLSQTTTERHTVLALTWLIIVNTGMNPDRLKSAVHGKRPFLCCDALCRFLPAVITIL